MSAVLIREAEITRDVFFRDLPEAIDHRTCKVEGDVITIDGGRIVIRLTDKKAEAGRPALLLADFAFDGMSDDEIRGFMDRFDRVKARP